MAKRKNPATDNRGAADERACIKRKIKQILKNDSPSISSDAVLIVLLNWIDNRSERFRARKGGL